MDKMYDVIKGYLETHGEGSRRHVRRGLNELLALFDDAAADCDPAAGRAIFISGLKATSSYTHWEADKGDE